MTDKRTSALQRHAGRIAILGAGLTLALAAAGPALAHGPDPTISTVTWPRDTVATYQWLSGWAPPAWAATAIDAGAADVGESRNSRAAVFVRAASSPAWMSYNGPTNCDSYGIACMDRTGMTVDGTFRVWFRPQGWMFDWGSLKWCQYYSSPPDRCYDIETTSLDELGHVEILGHHVNFADESDFTDAVVQYAGHTKPKAGWNQHVFGRCDVARLQLEYERRDPGNLVSTCLSLATTITFAASEASVAYSEGVTFTATLKIAFASAAEAMSGDWLSGRTLVLQRRAIGSATWTTVSTFAASPTYEGSYNRSLAMTATYDWRVSFATPPGEGLIGATSSVIRVSVSSCSSPPCPLSTAP